MEEVERNLDKIRSKKGVKSVIVMNYTGQILNQSVNEGYEISDTEAKNFASMSYQVALASKASIKQHISQEEVQFLRVRMKQNEALIIPEEKYILVVIQDPVVETS